MNIEEWVPWNYFVIAVPSSKTVRMLLNNVFNVVKPMLGIHRAVCHFCRIIMNL